MLRIPFEGETEESILSRIRFCARRNGIDPPAVEVASKKLLEMLVDGGNSIREKGGVELVDRQVYVHMFGCCFCRSCFEACCCRVTLAKKKEIDRKRREEEELAKQLEIEEAREKVVSCLHECGIPVLHLTRRCTFFLGEKIYGKHKKFRRGTP